MNSDNCCTTCHKTGNDINKLLTCNYCFAKTHLKCLKKIGKTIKQNESDCYFCSTRCSAMYERIINMRFQSDIPQLIDELKCAVRVNMQTVIEQVKTVTSAIETSQEFLSTKFESILADFKVLKDENRRLIQEVNELRSSQSSLSALVYKQEAEIDRQNKKSVVNNVVMFGVPFRKSENLSEITATILGKIGAASSKNSVVSVARMHASDRNPMSPIRIVFQDKKSKDQVLRMKKQFGKLVSTMIDSNLAHSSRTSVITLNDELTPLSNELLNELRQVQKKLNLKYVWPGRGGVILIKSDENSKPIEIRNRLDMHKFFKQSQ